MAVMNSKVVSLNCGDRLNKGFLLIESMVALAILSIGILGLVASQVAASKKL